MNNMNDENEPLFTLTIAQYSKLLRELFSEEVDRILMERRVETNNQNQETDICDIVQASETTRLVKSTLYSKVSKRQIPCLSRGKPLLFSRDHLEMWLQAGRPKTDSMDAIKEILRKKQSENYSDSE